MLSLRSPKSHPQTSYCPISYKQRLKRWLEQEVMADDPYDVLNANEVALLAELSLRHLLRQHGMICDRIPFIDTKPQSR